MEYSYQARDEKGMLKTGTVEALSPTLANSILQEHKLTVIKIEPARKFDIFQNIKFLDHVSLKELVLFSRQLSTLIDAKVPIIQALTILKEQVSSAKLKTIIDEISERVKSGDSLSTAMSAYPKVFSPFYINLLRAGELSGTLDESLTYLANQLEKDYELKSKVIGALTYPAFIVSALLVVGFLMFVYVLPPLIGVLQEAEVELPFTTNILIGMTNFMQNFWWIILILIVGGTVGLRVYSDTQSGRHLIDYLKIKIPVFGKLFEKIYMARFSRNLSTLVAGGIPIVKALDSVADIVGNAVYHDIILEASSQVRNGKSIASALVNSPEFPAIVAQMTQIGESTGKLKEILEKLATFYEKEVEGVLKVLTTLIEPMIMILIGFAVAVMVAGILLPMYNLAGAV
jgi:type II secretory pathway component PulF